MTTSKVLVTGGSGFVGAHALVQLIEAGYQVRTTVRSLKREDEVRAMLKNAGCVPRDALAFVVADLNSDEGWSQAVEGCDYVLHVASPFPSGAPKHEDELIVPARDGALRVLRAARDAGVKRVVLTSSFAAVGYSQPAKEQFYTEDDWTDVDTPGLGGYIKSKTVAERAAWEFIDKEGEALELAVINPVGIFGPVLGADYSSSIQLIKRLLDGDMMPMSNFPFGVVDVRDVANLHLRAMTHPAAKGERFLAVAGESVNLQKIAHILKTRLGDIAAHVSEQSSSESGMAQHISNAKAKRLLGWSPRSNEEALLASAESLVQLALLNHAK
ncbi:aldehyde reductase [bacterium]|nr:MAG: aldehyde reductase [bacterium]